MNDRPRRDQESWVLPAACGLAAFETVVAIAIVLFHGHRSAPATISILAIKLPICWLVLRRNPAAVLLLFLWEVVTTFAALVGPHFSIWLRVLDLVTAMTVIVLLALSVRLFPSPELPGAS